MQLPPRSPDLETAIDNLHQRFSKLEQLTLSNVDELARSGFADMRWCSIARTHVEEAFMAMHRALRDYPGDDPNNYGKVPHPHPLPQAFAPPVDPEPLKNVASQTHIEWRDYGPGETLDPPDRPDPPDSDR